MTILSPMRPEAYDAYLEQAIAGYAHDNVAAGRWPQASALEHSRADFAQLLPQGLATPGNYLFEIRADETGPVVGVIWFAVTEQNGMPVAFVYDVEIKPEWQRQGHAMRAFKALEPLVKELGLSRIGLHVFANNPGAQALYARLGYDVVSLNMAKQLGTKPQGKQAHKLRRAVQARQTRRAPQKKAFMAKQKPMNSCRVVDLKNLIMMAD